MPLPQDLAEFCIDLDTGPGEVCVTLPGGARVCANLSADITDPSEHVKALFASVNGALAPLKPTFDIIETILALKSCVEAIPKIFTSTPPNPAAVAQCVPNLVEKVEVLLNLLPQISIPLLIKEIIRALILFFQGLRRRIVYLIQKLNNILAAQQRATSIPSVQLQSILDCATANLDVELVNLNESLSPVNRLINLINALADLAGLPCIPAVTDISELAQPALDAIDTAIEFLRALDETFDIPGFKLGGGGAFEKICEDN